MVRETPQVVACGQRGPDGVQAAGHADLLQGGQVPALGRVDRDGHRARPGPADLAPDDQQPGGEQPGRAAILHRLEERQVHQAGRVVQGREDDPLAGADGRRLGRHLRPGDQDYLPVLAAGQVRGADHAEAGQQVGVEAQDVLAQLEAEDLEFGRDPLGQVEVAELAGRDEVGHAVPYFGVNWLRAALGEQVEGVGRPVPRTVPGRVGLPGQHADPGQEVPAGRAG